MAFLIFVATRLQNIVARSSRTRIRALCVRAATSAMRLTGTKSRSSEASAASASPAKSVIFPAATPSIHTSVSPSSSSHSKRLVRFLKCDQVGPLAGFFSRLNSVVPSLSRSSSSRMSSAR